MSSPDLSDAQLEQMLAQAREPQRDALARQWNANVREALLGRPGEPTRVGRFVIVRAQGRGGMGTVFLAYDPDLDRKVALKVLRARGDSAREALLREGRALARLSHPNVVTVYEVGAAEEDLFVAMEYVEGQSLAQWLETPRPWKAIVEIFRQAGAGLAAAHAAGLVHHDFKPANVLVREDGTVQVVDLGLARLEEELQVEREPTDQAPASAGEPEADPFRSQTTAARRGGTFAYMAPERLAGKPGDARGDQFSFCVALFEALYGERPFSATSVEGMIEKIRGGVSTLPRKGPVLPPRIRRALLRGLAFDPAQRFESMRALTEQLRVDGRRAAWLGAAAVVAIAAVGGAYLAGGTTARDEAACTNAAADAIDDVWNDERAAAIESSFAATGLDYAATSFAGSRAVLDRYADAWSAMRAQSCEATRRGQQSESALDLRMACLDRRRTELRALTNLFADADAALVRRAVSAAERLTPLDACADVESLAAVVPPPEDATLREQVGTLQAEIARGWAEADSDHAARALEIADAAVETARALDYGPVLAEALLLRAHALDDLARYEAAEAIAKEAMYAAEAARHDEATARAATLLAHITRRYAIRPETSEDWAELARAAYTRLGVEDGLTSDLAIAIANNHLVAGRHAQAVTQYERALELAAREGHRTRQSAILSNLGATHRRQGKLTLARETLARALDQARELGEHHPTVNTIHNNLANVLDELGEAEAALEHYRAALAGVEHDAALAGGGEHIDAAQIHNNIGTVLETQGDFAGARDAYARAIAIAEEVHDGEHRDIALWTTNLGGALRKLGRPEEALAAHDRSIAMFERVLPDDHLLRVHALLGRGEDLTALDRAGEAAAALEEALDLAARTELDPDTLARVRFALADALWPKAEDTPRSRARERAVTLSEEALATFRAAPAGGADVKMVEAWMRARGIGSAR